MTAQFTEGMLIKTHWRIVAMLRAGWLAMKQITKERAHCPFPPQEQESISTKLVVKLPKDVFASARQTNCVKLFYLTFGYIFFIFI